MALSHKVAAIGALDFFEPILRLPWDSGVMNEQTRIDPEALIREVTRYLAGVDAFRAANCEPNWRPELVSEVTIGSQAGGLVAQSHKAF